MKCIWNIEVMIKYDEFIDKAIETVNKINQEEVVAAFVGSLSTKNLPARSAFGSYVVLKNLKKYRYEASKIFTSGGCKYTGLSEEFEEETDENRILNYPFQVRHTRLNYSLFDLITFNTRNVDEPTETDSQILSTIFDSIRSLPESAQLTELNKSIQGKFKSNKHQRTIMLETFGYAGILKPKGQKNYKDDFLTYEFVNSQQPSEYYKREWDYPTRYWTGQDGIDEENLNYYFAQYL